MSYNLTTMQSIYHNQDEIVEITYNNSPVYQKSGPTPPSTYDIRYTTTDNQQLTLSSSTGVVSHTFENNTGYITLDSNKEVPASMFQYCTTLHKIYYSTGVTFESSNGYQHDGCTSLDYVELPSDLVEIPLRCFRECESLCEMTVPSTVTTIGIFAWWKCGLNNHTSGYYQPDIKFTSITPAQNIDPDYTFSTDAENGYYTAQVHNTIYKLVPYEAWPDYASNAKWRTSNNYIDWYDTDTTDYALLPFFIENTTDTAETITIRNRDNVTSGSDMSGTMSISDDGTTWTELCTLPQSNFTFTLPAHTRKYLKATCTSFSNYTLGNAIYGMDTVGGNINSLANGNGKVDVPGEVGSAFTTGNRDTGNDALIDAKNLCVDYIAGDGGLGRLFSGCHNLTHAPKIWGGQGRMSKSFLSCNRLTHAPKILDNTLKEDHCYHAFEYDSYLTAVNIGEITYASTNDPDDFDRVFYSCSSLSYIKCMLDPSTLHNNFSQFTTGVSANGVFVKKAGVSWPTGANGIPSGWTVLEATE